LRRKAGVKIFDLGANAILRKGVFDLSGDVAIRVAEPVEKKNEQDKRDYTNRSGSGSDDEIAAIDKTAATSLRGDGMFALRVLFGNGVG